MLEISLVMWIDPETEWLVGEEIIRDDEAALSHISTIVQREPSDDDDEEEDDPHNLKGQGWYDIDPARVEELQQYLDHKMEPDQYIYQFGIFEVDESVLPK